jgi:16S rRNA (cytidine1402-2'-O)-methyltransferase
LLATPIGNLGDITQRALDLLATVNTVVCEDTRVTRKLLTAYGLARPLVTYHEHNAERVRPRLIRRMAAGEAVALVSDAGTPLVSDPGYKLVRAALEAGLSVQALPGASAVLAALCVSGLPSDRFFFGGFLPAKPAARRAALGVRATLIFFESARRLSRTLADITQVLGARPAAVAREITKLYEEVRRDDLAALAVHYEAAGAPKGEVVIVVGPPGPAQEVGLEELDDRLRTALGAASLRDAAAVVAAESGLPKRQVYARALELTRRAGTPDEPESG